jgi:prophage regulatory protein
MRTIAPAGHQPVTPDRLMRLQELAATSGLSKTTIYQLMKEGKFPKSIRIHARLVGWSEKAVQKWIQERIAASEASQ